MPRVRAAKSAAVASKPTWGITQEELVDYRAYHEEQKRIAAELEVRKKSLMERVAEGIAIEPGTLTASINCREVRLFTAEQVGRILGPDVVAEIRTQLTSTVQRSLTVVPR